MDFTVFDTKKIDEYAKRAKEQWGNTEEYKEYEKKDSNLTEDERMKVTNDFMNIFAEIGCMKDMDPASDNVQLMVQKLQNYITEHFYMCSKEILSGLGNMYAAGGEFTDNIDKVGGIGTAVFTDKAIQIFCSK